MKTLSIIEKALFLKKMHLFQEIDIDLLISISEKGSQDFYTIGEIVFDIGEIASQIFIILSGSITLLDSENQPICELSKYSYFGEEAVLSNQIRQYKAIATSEVSILTFSKVHLKSILIQCPTVALLILENFAKNLICKYKKPD
ncbi:MAG TPA: cyclic nucleotide-binding domain-containing protein [Chlamydiales bacterium]|nr:cyclic nucleotide-binding domain-containing protein [Chlamydiales bacterium]